MPLLKKKVYNLTPSPNDLQAAEELFVIPETKECFRTYDEYIAKVFLYSSQHWSCQYSGQSGLTYNDAQSSEEKALKQLNSFPDCFKETVLRTVHKGEGSLREVVEKCLKFLTTRYYPQEEVVVLKSKDGKKRSGVVTEVLNSNKEVPNLNLDSNKENGGQRAAGTKVVECKYSVQLKGSDVVLTDILTSEIKRKTKLPLKRLLKLFIKSNAEIFSVDGKDMWLLKDDLVQKYDLPSVSKSSIGLKEAKNLLRSPLDTIAGPNGINTPKQKTKKISPKNPKGSGQRTLNFFVQTPNANATTPTKKNSPGKMRGSPVVPELKIILTPKSAVKEMLEKSSGKSKQDSAEEDNDKEIEGNAIRNLFTVHQDETKVIEKAEKVGGKTQKTIPDDDEKDFVVKKQSVKTSKAKKKTSTADAKTSSGKKSAEKKFENDLKQDENIQLNKLNDFEDKKVSDTKKPDVITLDNDFGEHEKKIVEKNALKKQKTLSQMFKLITSKKSSKIHEGVQSGSKRDVEKVCSKNELAKKIETPAAPKIPLPLPTPNPVVVPEQFGKHYGDVLMITEFIYTYENFLSEDAELKCSPDDLVSGLLSDGTQNGHFLRILISFLDVLLTDLCRQRSSEKFSDLGMDLLDMTVSEATVGELTKLYLQRCHNAGQHSTKNEENLGGEAQRKLSENILMDLNKEDIVNLSAVQKLEVLVYLLEHILISGVFYSHYRELEDNRRQAWVTKIEVETEIRDLLQEQRKKEELKHPQMEIDTFLKKNESGDGDMVVEGDANDPDPVKETHETKEDDSGRNGMTEENAKSSSLTRRQKMAEESKIEKEKQNETRRFGEELYQRRQKIERLKGVINEARDRRRTKALGSDRNDSRYWLFKSYPERLFVERTPCLDVVDDDLKEGGIDLSPSENPWYYYTSTEAVVRLMSALHCRDEKENALKRKLKILTNAKKLSFNRRQTSLSNDCAETNRTDDFVKLKEELCDLASRITESSLGNIEDLETWSENVSSRSSHGDLVTFAVELASAVGAKSLSKQLGDRELWLKEHWVPAVMDSTTTSRLRFCLAVLDCCIKWDTCTLYLKCKICRRNGGTMAVCDKCRQGYHIECLRPALEEVPDEEWLCCICTRGNNTRRGARREYCEVVDEEETQNKVEKQDEVANDDYCDVCGCEGTLICCDNCPKVYHKECHDPPLRNIPRGVWKCCSCQGRRPTASKYEEYSSSSESSVLEFTEDEPTHKDDSSEHNKESGSESESSVDDTAAVERAERAKKRKLVREEEAAKAERSNKKKKTQKRKRNASAKGKDEKVQNKKCLEIVEDVLNEDSTEEGEEISRAEKRPRLRNEGNKNRSNRKRKCDTSYDEHSGAKRKPRQNPELHMCKTLLKDLMHHEDSWPFIEPVDISEVPDYLEVVSSPMDFSTIKRKLNAFDYSSYENCLSDIILVFANSVQYNLNTSDEGLAGLSLDAHFKEILPNYFPEYKLQKLPQESSRLRSRKRRS